MAKKMWRNAVWVTCLGGVAVLAVGCRDSAIESNDRLGHIYFLSGRSEDEPAAMYRVAPNGRGLERLTEGMHTYVYAVTEDGRGIVATVNNDVVIAQPLLTKMRTLAASPSLDWHPSLSPDGKSIVFESSRHSFRDIYRVDAATGLVVRLTNNHEGNFDPAWSPDGRRIAFASSRSGQLDLFVMDADGLRQTRLTSHRGDSIRPAWSADGRWIAFLSGRDGRDELYAIRPDGSGLSKVGAAPIDAGVERFSWRPSRNQLLYTVRDRHSGSRMWLTGVEPRKPARRFASDENELDPAWSPSGDQFVFVRGHGMQRELWLRDMSSNTARRIVIDVPDVWLPRWLNTKTTTSGRGNEISDI